MKPDLIIKPGYYFSLNRNNKDPFIEMEVKGFMRGSDFRNNTFRMFQYLQSMNLNKLLIKAREMRMIDMENRNWLENYFLPYATSNGLHTVCFEKPEDSYAFISLELVMFRMPEDKLRGAYYTDVKEARNWLNSQLK